MAVTMILTDYIPFIVGIGATFLTLWSTVPQIKKTMKTKEADDVSKWLIISLIAGLSLWTLYGFLKGDFVIMIANSIGTSLNVYLLILKWKYTR
jgi:MtN3 and saliva related transmembrane protein